MKGDVRMCGVLGGLEGVLCSRCSFVGQQGFGSDGNRIFRLQLPDSQRFSTRLRKKGKTENNQTTHTQKNHTHRTTIAAINRILYRYLNKHILPPSASTASTRTPRSRPGVELILDASRHVARGIVERTRGARVVLLDEMSESMAPRRFRPSGGGFWGLVHGRCGVVHAFW